MEPYAPADTARFEALFENAKDAQNMVQPDELLRCVRSLGVQMDRLTLDNLGCLFQPATTGRPLDKRAFVRFLHMCAVLGAESRGLHDLVFIANDEDMDGALSVPELTRLLGQLGLTLGDEVISDLMRGRPRIAYPAFCDAMKLVAAAFNE